MSGESTVEQHCGNSRRSDSDDLLRPRTKEVLNGAENECFACSLGEWRKKRRTLCVGKEGPATALEDP